ncbi:MAG TPA: hypothetical protein VND64_07830 [Pirellulales bacterium]|nr:hypothetical protein [Pirellulales bacterium]
MKQVTAEALAGAVRSHARTAARSRQAIAAVVAVARRDLPRAEFVAWLRSTFAGGLRRSTIDGDAAVRVGPTVEPPETAA